MGSTLDSVDNMLSSAYTYGLMHRSGYSVGAATSTTATSTSGKISTQRLPRPIVMPAAFGTGINQVYMTHFRSFNAGTVLASIIFGIEYLLLTYRYVNITMTANTGTDVLTVTAHGCSNGDWVRFTTTTTLPAPLAINTDYYVINKTTNDFQVALTSGGAAIDITTTGTGTHTCFSAATAGVSMPTKNIRIDGQTSSITTASLMTCVTTTNQITATTPGLTITYTDQDGNTGNTCSMTLPTSPGSGSGFIMNPHLASGDTGVRAVTNMVASAGTVGTYKVYGLLPLAYNAIGGSTSLNGAMDTLINPFPMFPIGVNENLNFYIFNVSAAYQLGFAFTLLADV